MFNDVLCCGSDESSLEAFSKVFSILARPSSIMVEIFNLIQNTDLLNNVLSSSEYRTE